MRKILPVIQIILSNLVLLVLALYFATSINELVIIYVLEIAALWLSLCIQSARVTKIPFLHKQSVETKDRVGMAVMTSIPILFLPVFIMLLETEGGPSIQNLVSLFLTNFTMYATVVIGISVSLVITLVSADKDSLVTSALYHRQLIGFLLRSFVVLLVIAASEATASAAAVAYFFFMTMVDIFVYQQFKITVNNSKFGQ